MTDAMSRCSFLLENGESPVRLLPAGVDLIEIDAARQGLPRSIPPVDRNLDETGFGVSTVPYLAYDASRGIEDADRDLRFSIQDETQHAPRVQRIRLDLSGERTSAGRDDRQGQGGAERSLILK